MENQRPIIEFHDVSKVYHLGSNVITAAKGINLTINRGEFVVITGRSGSGKTTLLNLVSGLTTPTSGRVFLEGAELGLLPDGQQSRLRNQKIGFIFQFPSLLPSLSVLENVMLPTLSGQKKQIEMARQRAIRLLEEVGLDDRRDAYPRQLSAGQQQRVVVARALINEPEVLLADEPTSNLDEQTEREIMSLIETIHQQRQITVLMITHAMDLVRFGTRSIQMAGGRAVPQWQEDQVAVHSRG